MTAAIMGSRLRGNDAEIVQMLIPITLAQFAPRIAS